MTASEILPVWRDKVFFVWDSILIHGCLLSYPFLVIHNFPLFYDVVRYDCRFFLVFAEHWLRHVSSVAWELVLAADSSDEFLELLIQGYCQSQLNILLWKAATISLMTFLIPLS
jgi:hypothetical protein